MIATLDVWRLKCIDASGINLAMTRRYGRAPTGERVVGSVPQNDGQNSTLLGALSAHGVEAVMTVEGATDAEVFRTSIKQVLGPTLSPGASVVMDSLSAHKATGIQQMLARRGAGLRYLPPYSPDLSPIEPCGSKLNTCVRSAKARTRAVLDSAVTQALTTMTAADARGWFSHCGYALH